MTKASNSRRLEIHQDVFEMPIDIGDIIVYTSVKQGYSLLFAQVIGYTRNRLRILKLETGVEGTLSPKHVMIVTEQYALYDPDAAANGTHDSGKIEAGATAKSYLRAKGFNV